MSKSVAEILQEVKNRGELKQLTENINVVVMFSNQFQGLSVEKYRDFDAFAFERRVYVRYNGGWYDGTNHPASPRQEWRDHKPGYHLDKIEKRRFGSLGKIQEEVEELLDAHRQGSHVMILVEMSDLYGAMQGFLEENYPGFKMEDLNKFSGITRRAFENGHRG